MGPIIFSRDDKRPTRQEPQLLPRRVSRTLQRAPGGGPLSFVVAPPSVASGIRVGTPCVTTQGMGTEQMRTIADLIATAVTKGDADPENAVSKEVRGQVTELVTRFPAYPR